MTVFEDMAESQSNLAKHRIGFYLRAQKNYGLTMLEISLNQDDQGFF